MKDDANNNKKKPICTNLFFWIKEIFFSSSEALDLYAIFLVMIITLVMIY